MAATEKVASKKTQQAKAKNGSASTVKKDKTKSKAAPAPNRRDAKGQPKSKPVNGSPRRDKESAISDKEALSDSDSDTIQVSASDPQASAQDTESYRGVELKSVSGGLLTNDPIVFSGDSSLFYLAKDNAVAVYNLQNAEMVQNFSIPRGDDSEEQLSTKVLAIIANPDQPSAHQVYTFSADRKARLWDANTGTLIHTWNLRYAVSHVVIDPIQNNRFYCTAHMAKQGKKSTANEESSEKSRHAVFSVVLGPNKNKAAMSEVFKLTSAAAGLVVRHDGKWIAAYSKFRVQLVQIKPNGKIVQHKWHMTERVSTIAFHPGEPVLAVGDWRGRIMFWYCVDDTIELGDTEDRSIVRRPYHWHAHRVNAINFTEAGTMMLSGGEEGVLVYWQLANDTKDFLARLGSDILGIAVSPDQMYYALTLRDNTIRIFSAMDKSLVSSLQGLKYADRGAALKNTKHSTPEYARLARMLEADPFTTGLVVHPATHHLVLNGDPGHLQVFNHVNDRHLASVEVASFNWIGGDKSLSASQPHVDLVQYSSDGTWMATVDSRSTSSSYGPVAVAESYLKFWKLDPSDQTYKLVTRIDNPHINGVQDIAFQPVARRSGAQGRSGDAAGLLCVSTGKDRTFRVWELQSLPSYRGGTYFLWSCRSQAHYRGQQPRGAAFSGDGSMLAVTFGGVITLWDAATCLAPVATLVASATTPTLSGVSFVGSTSYLAAWSADRLDVWNMLTGSVWWTLAMPIQSVFVHQRQALLAVAAYQIPGSSLASILVLSPASPSPVVSLHQTGGIEAIALVPSATSSKSGRSHPETELGQPKADPLADNSLVVLTPTGLLNVYAAKSDTLTALENVSATKTKSVEPAGHGLEHSVFASIFGENRQPANAADEQKAAPSANAHVRNAMRLVRSAVQSAYVNAPFHVLPPISSLYDQFVTAQLQPLSQTQGSDGEDSAKPAAEKQQESNEQSDDVQMSDVSRADGVNGSQTKHVNNSAFLRSVKLGFKSA
ncbi:NET1-associated nuclear protein 1 [Dipsacomyces acuminosporus]|nr:NET1-associated nuclear protein 1 [Dipsacomyces acuminosporus]